MYELINFSYKESDNKEGLFTSYHKKYDVTIEYNGKSFSCEYQCNRKAEVKKEEVIICIIMDAETIWYGCEDVDSIMREYGYTDRDEAERVFNLCKKTSEALEEMLTEAEIETITEELEEYR